MKRLIAVLVLAAPICALRAQNPPADVVGYVSLTHSPIGLLVPFAPAPSDAVRDGAGVAFRYGSLSKGARNNKSRALGVSALLPVGQRTVLSVTGGTYKETCPDPECKNILMIGACGQFELTPTRRQSRDPFSIALSGDVGWSAKQFETTYLTAHAGLPVSFALGDNSESVHASVWAAPGLGFGRASISGNFPGSGSHTGTVATIAGGVALFTASPNLSVQLGVMHIATKDAKTSVGLNLVLRP